MSPQFQAQNYLFKAPSVMFHVGTLNPKDKGKRGPSQEGLGLSVSDQPDEWIQIAKLGGLPRWKSKTKGLKFVDGYELIESHKDDLMDWAVKSKLADFKTAYAYHYYDDEMGSVMEMLLPNLQAVAEELNMQTVSDIQNTVEYSESITEIKSPVPTLILLQRTGQPLTDEGRPSSLVIELLATLWAEEQKVDGIWWEVDHEPGEVPYSANRAVIFSDSINKVVWEKVWEPEYRSVSKSAFKP